MNSPIDDLALFAARYSFDRNTGAGMVTRSALRSVWGDLSEIAKERILRDSEQAEFDQEVWGQFRAAMKMRSADLFTEEELLLLRMQIDPTYSDESNRFWLNLIGQMKLADDSGEASDGSNK